MPDGLIENPRDPAKEAASVGRKDRSVQASNFFGVIEDRQGLKVACIEEIAFSKGFINRDQLHSIIANIPETSEGSTRSRTE